MTIYEIMPLLTILLLGLLVCIVFMGITWSEQSKFQKNILNSIGMIGMDDSSAYLRIYYKSMCQMGKLFNGMKQTYIDDYVKKIWITFAEFVVLTSIIFFLSESIISKFMTFVFLGIAFFSAWPEMELNRRSKIIMESELSRPPLNPERDEIFAYHYIKTHRSESVKYFVFHLALLVLMFGMYAIRPL